MEEWTRGDDSAVSSMDRPMREPLRFTSGGSAATGGGIRRAPGFAGGGGRRRPLRAGGAGGAGELGSCGFCARAPGSGWIGGGRTGFGRTGGRLAVGGLIMLTGRARAAGSLIGESGRAASPGGAGGAMAAGKGGLDGPTARISTGAALGMPLRTGEDKTFGWLAWSVAVTVGHSPVESLSMLNLSRPSLMPVVLADVDLTEPKSFWLKSTSEESFDCSSKTSPESLLLIVSLKSFSLLPFGTG